MTVLLDSSFVLPIAGLLLLMWRMWPRGRALLPVLPSLPNAPVVPKDANVAERASDHADGRRVAKSNTVRPAGGSEAARAESSQDGGLPKVSIIVPARNEAHNLPKLLSSLAALTYPKVEVVVVDDHSTDATAATAALYPVKVVRGADRPSGWGGKQWACMQGARAATGDVLLFTDADTEHAADSLQRSVNELVAAGAGLLSALPYHANPTLWERWTGPFQLLLQALTAPYEAPRPGRVFAIGQYLMFTREAYESLGGHAAVAATMVEDLPLANLCLDRGISLRVYRGREALFSVRMYDTLGDFCRGWRRNFRAGFRYASPRAGLDAVLMVAGVSGGMQLHASCLAVMLTAMLFVAWRQRSLGRFSLWGAVLWPWSLGLFCYVTALALYDTLLQRDFVWKGRAYAKGALS